MNAVNLVQSVIKDVLIHQAVSNAVAPEDISLNRRIDVVLTVSIRISIMFYCRNCLFLHTSFAMNIFTLLFSVPYILSCF